MVAHPASARQFHLARGGVRPLYHCKMMIQQQARNNLQERVQKWDTGHNQRDLQVVIILTITIFTGYTVVYFIVMSGTRT